MHPTPCHRKQSIRITDWAQTPVFSVDTGSIVVRLSTLPNAGLGLFVCVDMVDGQLVTLYSGDLVSTSEALCLLDHGHGSHLRGLFCAYQSIDGIRLPRVGLGGGSFINQPPAGTVGNAVFVPFLGKVYVRATQAIRAGEEILIPYGSSYPHQRPMSILTNRCLVWFRFEDGRVICGPDGEIFEIVVDGIHTPLQVFMRAYRGFFVPEPTERIYHVLQPRMLRWQSDNVEMVLVTGLDTFAQHIHPHLQIRRISHLLDLPTHPATGLDTTPEQIIRKVYQRIPRRLTGTTEKSTYLTPASLLTVYEQCGLGAANITLLWIGVGDGRGALAVQKANPGVRIIGVDLNNRWIEMANQNARTILGHDMCPLFQVKDGFDLTLTDLQRVTHIYSSAPNQPHLYEHLLQISSQAQSVGSIIWFAKYFKENGIREQRHGESKAPDMDSGRYLVDSNNDVVTTFRGFSIRRSGSGGQRLVWSTELTPAMREFIRSVKPCVRSSTKQVP